MDGDGWQDLFLVTGDELPNMLLRNNGGTFEDITSGSGLDFGQVTTGAGFADLDGDGHADVLVGTPYPGFPRLFKGNGAGVFTEQFNTTFPQMFLTTSPSFGDYDRDGDLDLFLAQWNSTPAHLLWRNDGDFSFASVSSSAFGSAHALMRFTFTPNFTDIDGDEWPDLLIASDFGRSQTLINNADGTFTRTTDGDVITDEHGMGAAVADYDNDGDMDWFVTSIHYDGPQNPGTGTTGNRMYRNDGGVFTDVTEAAGVRAGDWGWGACFADFNNDGQVDLFHVNGWRKAGDVWFDMTPARLFINQGDGSFTEEAAQRGVDDTSEGRGVVCFDYDRDGDIDILTANTTGRHRLFRNELEENGSVQVELRDAFTANRYGVGAWLTLTANGITMHREMRAGSNYLSANPLIAHFGIGSASRAARLDVRWADGHTSTVLGIGAGAHLTVAADLVAAGGFE